MYRFAGFVLVGVGALCIAWFIVVAGGFALVALKGFMGTAGREAGGGLAVSVLALLTGSAFGVLMIRFGGKLIAAK